MTAAPGEIGVYARDLDVAGSGSPFSRGQMGHTPLQCLAAWLVPMRATSRRTSASGSATFVGPAAAFVLAASVRAARRGRTPPGVKRLLTPRVPSARCGSELGEGEVLVATVKQDCRLLW